MGKFFKQDNNALLVLNEKTDEDANKDEVIKLEAERIKDEVQERINNIKEKFKKNKEIKATPSMQIDIEDNKNEEEIKIEEERIEEIKIKAEKIKKEEEIKIEAVRIKKEKSYEIPNYMFDGIHFESTVKIGAFDKIVNLKKAIKSENREEAGKYEKILSK